MTGAIPIPSDTTHTNVNARAFVSDRPAYIRSRQRLVNMAAIQPQQSFAMAKQFMSKRLDPEDVIRARAGGFVGAIDRGTPRRRAAAAARRSSSSAFFRSFA